MDGPDLFDFIHVQMIVRSSAGKADYRWAAALAAAHV
jgi:hypothetical protein